MTTKALAALAMLNLSTSSFAATQYITDVTYIPIRTGPGTEYRIIHRGLRTGTALEVLEKDVGNGYSRVKYGEDDAFIESQYLTALQPAAQRLAVAQQTITKLEAKTELLETQLLEKGQQLENATEELGNSEQVRAQQQNDLKVLQKITAEPLAFKQRNEILLNENEQIKSKLQVIQGENAQLHKDERLRWFMAGGSIIVLGILIGLFLPLISFRKKKSDWAWSVVVMQTKSVSLHRHNKSAPKTI